MPVICSACGGQRPYGDFVQIGFKADPAGYYREITQRANGLRLSEWRALVPGTVPFETHAAGVYCKQDGALILADVLMAEEKELLQDRRLPVQQEFHSEELAARLVELGKRVRSDVYVHQIPAQAGAYDESLPLAGWLKRKLQKLGVSKLYQHQAEAIQHVRQGRNVVIGTKTASGKSLSYNIPIMEKLIADREACALYLSPFRALVEDQFNHIRKWADSEGDGGSGYAIAGFAKFHVEDKEIAAGLLQGQKNVAQHLRKDQSSGLVFEQGRYWMTNVYYLHLILQGARPQMPKSAHLLRFLKNLRFVVIDELHQYSGMLGSKVSMVIRRLRMLCERVGNKDIQFIACSATIANAKFLAEELTGKRGIQGFHEVTGDRAPGKKKDILMWNPGLSDSEQKKRAVVSDLYEILQSVYSKHSWPRSIIFSSNRQQAQLLSRELNMILRTHLKDNDLLDIDDHQELFLPYHANLPQDVKEATIQKLEQGEILGVVTTRALEVGIDVQCLDLCILLGYPGSQASFWQQAGRVGRSRDGLVMMMMQEEPLQQYFARNPDDFFRLSPESATININNPKLLKEHLAYAAHEQGGVVAKPMNYIRSSVIRKVVAEPDAQWRQDDGNLIYQGETPRYQYLVAKGETYSVVAKKGWSEENLFQNVDARSLIRDYHVDAVFLGSDNRTFYKVKWLNSKQRKVIAEAVRVDYHTRGIIRDSIEVHDVSGVVKQSEQLKASLGNILVKRSTFGYKKIFHHSAAPAETVQLTSTYPVSFLTEGFWLMWEGQGKYELAELLKGHQSLGGTMEELVEGSLHAAEHAIASVIPAVVKCGKDDFQHTSFYSGSALFGMPGLFIYDSQAGGGSGIVEAVAEKFDVLLEKARLVIGSCGCSDGCPSCIQLFQCERQNEPLHKAGGLLVLDELRKQWG